MQAGLINTLNAEDMFSRVEAQNGLAKIISPEIIFIDLKKKWKRMWKKTEQNIGHRLDYCQLPKSKEECKDQKSTQ